MWQLVWSGINGDQAEPLPSRGQLALRFNYYTDSTPLRETQNNMCSSGSSHAILHMATFKGFFFFFHGGFNLICCPGIEEAEHIMELYSVIREERDG